MKAKNSCTFGTGPRAARVVVPFRCPPAGDGFSPEDLRALRRWAPETMRVEIEDEEAGQLAMIYAGDRVWASWAIGREGELTLLWDCVSLRTLGRYASARDALAAIPVPRAPRQSAEVIPFLAHMRTAALRGRALQQ